MCGIAGIIDKTEKNYESFIKKMLETIKHRGPDNCGIYSSKNITLGNVLLKLTGNKLQPIANKGVLTYNGEIYNFKTLSHSLNLNTYSDSETLFELIESEGIEKTVSKLDGDYAFAYLENEKLYLARDPLGVKPLYYVNTPELFAFASEKKAFSVFGIDESFSLLGGEILTYENGMITKKQITEFTTTKEINDEKKASELLFNAIKKAVKKRYHKHCGIAFSGGLDSSLIAGLCKDVKLYSVGMKNSHDILQTKKASHLLGLDDKLHLHELSLNDIEKALPDVVKAVGTDPLKVSIAFPLYIASKDAHNDGMRVILSGQGADELFAGYKRYENMTPELLEVELIKDLNNIAQNNLERDDAVTMANSVELRVPFLDNEVVKFALSMPTTMKVNKGIRKYILRLASLRVLPDELAFKEKKAAQYSSGINSALVKIAKKNGHRSLKEFLEYM